MDEPFSLQTSFTRSLDDPFSSQADPNTAIEVGITIRLSTTIDEATWFTVSEVLVGTVTGVQRRSFRFHIAETIPGLTRVVKPSHQPAFEMAP